MAQTSTWLIRGVALLIIGLIVGIAGGYFLYPAITPSKEVTVTVTGGVALPSEIKIGALYSLSGSLATYGQNGAAALELAVQEANEYLQKAGIGVTVKLYLEDTQTDPNVALQKLQALAAQGIKFFIGPSTSAEARNILGYANDNNLLLLSPLSSAGDLSIPNDNLYRLPYPDKGQAVALAKLMQSLGIQYLVIINRNDVYGRGLATSLKSAFENIGGKTSDLISYDPATTEFTVQVSTLFQYVQNAINTVGNPKKVGVELATFEEAAQIIKTIVQNPQYDQVLRSVRWFGDNSITDTVSLVNDPDVAKFLSDTKFLSPIDASLAENEVTQKVKNYVRQKLGRDPDSFAYNSYDAFWLLFWSILTVGYDVNKVKQVLPNVAKGYIGASGQIQFDENGDRVPISYVLKSIEYIEGKWQWVYAGRYIHLNQSITLEDKYK